MHSHTTERWSHDHAFLGEAHETNERRTMFVVALTAATMVVEIIGGTFLHSMALVADGWHMATHVFALGLAALAYRYARLHSGDLRFSFGTGKLGELAGFTSAIALAMIAVLIGYESISRLLAPLPISYREAILIAVLGLLVNLASAKVLHGAGDHGHSHHGHSHQDHSHHGPSHHGHPHPHDQSHHDGAAVHAHDAHHGHAHAHDSNMRAAFVHVLAGALTSVLAIAALSAGALFGWTWADPIMGLVGTAVIIAWAISLVRSAGATLLDVVPDQHLAAAVREAVEIEGDRVADLHLWRLGPGHAGLILSIVTDGALTPSDYKRRLAPVEGLSHVTVEVNRCPEHARVA